MPITKLDKQPEADIQQHLFDAGDYLREEIYRCIHSYYDHQVKIDDPIVTTLFTRIDHNIDALESEIIDSLKYDAQQRENLSALKGCCLEDEYSEEEYPFLSESEEFEDSEITKI